MKTMQNIEIGVVLGG